MIVDVLLTILGQSLLFLGIAIVGYKLVAKKVNDTIVYLIDNLFRDKTVKSAMSVLGKKSGEVRTNEAATNTAAEQILTGPKMAGIKMGLGAVGIDLDEMIAKHGPVGTLAGLSQLGSLIGIDVSKVISDGLEGLGAGLLGGQGRSSSGENLHLKS